MKDYFSWMLKDTLEVTNPLFGWVPEQRSEKFRKYQLGEGPKAIQVASHGWISEEEKSCMRFARFQSGIIDIATVMIYPTASPQLLPIFAAEWVAVMDSVHVIVLDVEFLGDDYSHLDNGLLNLKNKWKKIFTESKDKPDWFEEIASPYAIYSSSHIDKKDNLKSMFREYLEWVYQHYYQPQLSACSSGVDHELVREYKRHHSLHSPARKIIKKDHAAWLDVFLEENHFKIIK